VCFENSNIEVFKLLLDKGVNIYLGRDEEGHSPLSISIKNSNIDIFNLLFEKIDDINMIIDDYDT
jgi:ankyrin repeat protein